MPIIIRSLVFAAGLSIVLITLFSTIRTFVLPRNVPDRITRLVFLIIRGIFDLRLKNVQDYRTIDRVMAYYAPISLMSLLPVWYVLVWIGYTLMFWAASAGSWYTAFRQSGSSLLTLGFEAVDTPTLSSLAFSEAAIGLILVALLIAYLPTMYAAFSRREAAVKLLEVRAGNPPSAIEMLKRYHRIQGFDRLSIEWERWESWFADIDESHTSLAPLVFFRSPLPEHSWVTAAGAVMDCAALRLSSLELPFDAQAALCIRSGYLALRHISDYFRISYDPNPEKNDSISIRRDEFEKAINNLQEAGLPVRRDRQAAWEDFAGWRVNYDTVLLSLAQLTQTPAADWISDRPTVTTG